jgi:hypothetical protein
MTVTFNYSSGVTTASLTTTFTEFFDKDFNNVSYKVIGEDIRVR